jgi:phosphohistidine phosphatase
MNLLLLRHGDADRHASSDFARKLTDKGRAQSAAVGSFLRRLDIRPDVIVTSPLARAVETATAALENLKTKIPLIEDERLACGMAPNLAFELIREQEKASCIMLVGHEPDFSGLAAALTGMGASLNIEMKKASCACFDLDMPGHSCATLKWLVPHKLISTLAGE